MSRPPLSEFQLGWICALPIELAAATEMLDDNYGRLEEQDANDSNSYILGRVGKHNIVIAGLGTYGTTSATTVAINMMRTFSQSLRIGLMVGIGGGIPSADHDVRLGDIVVSHPQGTLGGVVQYDRGRMLEGADELVRTGTLRGPPRSILTAVASLRAAELIDDPEFPAHVDKATSRNARTRRNFGRPDDATDRLFRPDEAHPTHTTTCVDCPSEWETTREQRPDPEPRVHYGIIASGDTLVRSAAMRDRIHRDTGALCFEMEAAGLMEDFPCIVIRGICDYSDSHKNKVWQGYAALVAAAYAKELLGYLPTSQLSHENLASDVCTQLVDEVRNVAQELQKASIQRESHYEDVAARAASAEYRQCLQIFKTSPYEKFKNINPDRAENTCRWLLDNPQYQAWRNNYKDDLLWISADPGCGKSVLAKSLVDQDLSTPGSPVCICYFFFKDNDDQNNLATALCALLHQLLAAQPSLIRHAIPLWAKSGASLTKEVEEMWRLLEAIGSDGRFTDTICVLDALDECLLDDQAILIKMLNSFFRRSSSSVKAGGTLKFVVTSRPYDEIQEAFHSTTRYFPRIRVRGEEKNSEIQDEISRVIKARVAALVTSLGLSGSKKYEIESQLLKMKNRTYLWLHLAMDDISHTLRHSLRPKDEPIPLVPASINAAYEKLLGRVPPKKVDIASSLLKIIVGARRPLTTSEMAMALGLAITPDATMSNQAQLDEADLGNKIRHLCGLFVFISDSRECSFTSPNPMSLMARVCVDYLLLDDFYAWDRDKKGPAPAAVFLRKCSTDFYTWTKDDPFIFYAAQNWAYHVEKMQPEWELSMQWQLDELYNVSTPRNGLWYTLFLLDSQDWARVMTDVCGLEIAAFNNHHRMLKSMLSREPGAIPADQLHKALMLASCAGSFDAVQLLVGYGVDVNKHALYSPFCDKSKYMCASALEGACLHDQYEIVDILLEHRADPNTRTKDDSASLLEMTCESTVINPEISKALIAHGALVNRVPSSHSSPLYQACITSNCEVVLALLMAGADPNAVGQDGLRPLYGCVMQQTSQGLFYLLHSGVDVNARGGDHGTALHTAVYTGNCDSIESLLRAGADPNLRMPPHDTALKMACRQGRRDIVALLLGHGADPNLGGEETPLAVAKRGGYIDLEYLLVENGAEGSADVD